MFFFIAVFAFRPVKYQPSPSPDEREWPEFFHMPVLMLMLITLLNDGTLISIGYDNVRPRATPEVWNLQVVFWCVLPRTRAAALAHQCPRPSPSPSPSLSPTLTLSPPALSLPRRC